METTILQAIMDAQGRRNDWLAERLGVSQALVSLLLSGKRNLTERTRERAAKALGVPETVLLEPTAPVAVLDEGHRAGRDEADHLVQAGERDPSPPPVFSEE